MTSDAAMHAAFSDRDIVPCLAFGVAHLRAALSYGESAGRLFSSGIIGLLIYTSRPGPIVRILYN